MSTETPDAEAAWQAYTDAHPEPTNDRWKMEKAAFLAGRESLAARLDALHAENLELADLKAAMEHVKSLPEGHTDEWSPREHLGHHVMWAVTDLALQKAEAERDALAQAIWDAYGILGFDQDGDKTPAAAIVGAKHDYAAFAEAWLIRSAREQAKDHTDLLDECTAVEAERDALRDAITALVHRWDDDAIVPPPFRKQWIAELRALLSEAGEPNE